MLHPDEAARVAHGRLKDLVVVAQSVCGGMNSDEPAEAPRDETGALLAQLGSAWEHARDGLEMLKTAEEGPTTVGVQVGGQGWSQ